MSEKSRHAPAIELERPDARFKDSFIEAVAEYQLEDRYKELNVLELNRNFDSFVDELLAKETTRSATRVPDTIYWAVDQRDRFVGRISMRHELNEFLSQVGGHIGYDVRPSMRGRGMATEMLRLCLQTPRAKQISKLLLTCDEDNHASRSVILKNGGVLGGRYRGEVIAAMDAEQATVASRDKLQFWITLT